MSLTSSELLHLNQIFVDWKLLNEYVFDMQAINTFIDKWEMILISSGHFVKGMRVRPVSTNELSNSRHCTIDGMLGILSMNILVLKSKLESIRKFGIQRIIG